MQLARFILMMGIGAAVVTAAPVTYIIDFSGVGLLPTSGTFTYDSALGANAKFTAFSVTWDSIVFDLKDSANNPHIELAAACGDSSSSSAFNLLTTPDPCGSATAGLIWEGYGYTGPPTGHTFAFTAQDNPYTSFIAVYQTLNGPLTEGYGAGFFTATAVPEPSTMLLSIAGGALLLLGKRRGYRTPKAK